MNKTIFLIFGLIILLPIQSVVAQQLQIAEEAKEEHTEIYITSEGDVHVKHILKKSPNQGQFEDFLEGEKSNVQTKNINGEKINNIIIGDYTGIVVFPNDEERIVEYDLDNALIEKDGVWTWHYDERYRGVDSKFFFSDDIDMIFVDNTPILLKDAPGINCNIPCEMILEFFEDTNVQTEEVIWEEHEFIVPIIALTEVNSFKFDQPKKSISFEVNETNKFITLVLPLELIWKPYQVYLDDEKIFKHDSNTNGTHVWMNVKPQSEGTITIIGTTVIPEFSIFLPLILGISLVTILQFKNKIILR